LDAFENRVFFSFLELTVNHTFLSLHTTVNDVETAGEKGAGFVSEEHAFFDDVPVMQDCLLEQVVIRAKDDGQKSQPNVTKADCHVTG
jgi:hypothetical protein